MKMWTQWGKVGGMNYDPGTDIYTAAAAAKSPQLCLTLWDPIDGCPAGSPSLGFSRQEHWSGLPFPSPMHESEKWKWSRSVVSDVLQPHGLPMDRGAWRARIHRLQRVRQDWAYAHKHTHIWFIKGQHLNPRDDLFRVWYIPRCDLTDFVTHRHLDAEIVWVCF